MNIFLLPADKIEVFQIYEQKRMTVRNEEICFAYPMLNLVPAIGRARYTLMLMVNAGLSLNRHVGSAKLVRKLSMLHNPNPSQLFLVILK